jgi:alkanesulfonate monooxygenase SsuD/methylene tetrahydromethanopterin reductase-like flavin-dependent oxidoreductase (luciferase family)
LFSAGYWVELARLAEQSLMDFLTIEDSLSPPPNRTGVVVGRLDSLLIAARVAPLTSRIGLVPSVTVTHTEPFHVSKAIATLDYVSSGRAGVRVQVSARPDEAGHFGRRTFPAAKPDVDPAARGVPAESLLEEAADYVEVLRRLWDSWEDDAAIRDVATGRFIDRTKLHYIDFAGRWFSVKGPSITPRPPQGQPLVTALAHSTTSTGQPYRFAVRSADVVFVTPQDVQDAGRIAAELASLHGDIGRPATGVTALADLVVFLGPTAAEARDRKSRLDGMLGRPYRSDAAVFAGTATELADLMEGWLAAGLDGFRLRPGGLPLDLQLICHELVPELQRRSLFRTTYDSGTLRGRFGLTRPASRYAPLSGH